MNEQQQTLFNALADPMRRNLLVNLVETSPKTATQLAHEYANITRQGILKHLQILETARLVTVHQQGREKRYTPTLDTLNELEGWIKSLTAKWDERLLRLKAFVESAESDE